MSQALKVPMHHAARQRFRLALAGVILAAAVFSGVHTIRWPMMWDSSVMHYGNFLISQGEMPYRDTIEPDLPGAYLAEGWAMHVFGGGDLGWRVYDLFLLAVLTLACIEIARPYDWLAGLLAGVSFALLHLRDGPRNGGQREEVVTVCLMVAVACLFAANRSRKPWPMLLFGLFAGMAVSIKPTLGLLPLFALIMLAYTLRDRQAILHYCGLGLLGLAAAASTSVLFLWEHHAFAAFLQAERLLLPYYAAIGADSYRDLLLRLGSHSVYLALLVGLLLVVLSRHARGPENWERVILGFAICSGLVSYLAQRKPFEHHTYEFVAFVLLFFLLEIAKASHSRGALRVVGLTGLIYATLYFVAGQAYRLHQLHEGDAVTPVLTADLTRLGGPALNHDIQCLDLVLACPSALYRMRLDQSTNFLIDFMLFPPRGSRPLPFYQQLLWNNLHAHPPRVIIVTNQWLGSPDSFDKLQQWPDLLAYLGSTYGLETTRVFGSEAYRIYLHRPVH